METFFWSVLIRVLRGASLDLDVEIIQGTHQVRDAVILPLDLLLRGRAMVQCEGPFLGV